MNEQKPDRWDAWITRIIRVAGIPIGLYAGLVSQNDRILGLAIVMMLGGVTADAIIDSRRNRKE